MTLKTPERSEQAYINILEVEKELNVRKIWVRSRGMMLLVNGGIYDVITPGYSPIEKQYDLGEVQKIKLVPLGETWYLTDPATPQFAVYENVQLTNRSTRMITRYATTDKGIFKPRIYLNNVINIGNVGVEPIRDNRIETAYTYPVSVDYTKMLQLECAGALSSQYGTKPSWKTLVEYIGSSNIKDCAMFLPIKILYPVAEDSPHQTRYAYLTLGYDWYKDTTKLAEVDIYLPINPCRSVIEWYIQVPPVTALVPQVPNRLYYRKWSIDRHLSDGDGGTLSDNAIWGLWAHSIYVTVYGMIEETLLRG